MLGRIRSHPRLGLFLSVAERGGDPGVLLGDQHPETHGHALERRRRLVVGFARRPHVVFGLGREFTGQENIVLIEEALRITARIPPAFVAGRPDR